MTITIDDFGKVEIRVGTILSAEKAEGADKLLRLVFDFGELTDENKDAVERLSELQEKYPGRDARQIMSAIAPFIADPSTLVGKQIAVCVNLEPRTFRGYISQGMILATGEDAETLSFLVPAKKVQEGVKVH